MTYIPRTRSRLDKIEPIKEDCTIASSHYLLSAQPTKTEQRTHFDQSKDSDNELDCIAQRRIEKSAEGLAHP